MKMVNVGNLLKFFREKENWLLSLFAALFFLFPIVPPLAHVTLLLIIFTAFFMFRKMDYWRIIKNTPVLWALSAIYAVILLGIINTPASSDWVSLHLEKYAKLIYGVVLILVLMGQDRLQRVAFNAFICAMLFILFSTWLNVWFLLPWSVTQETGWDKTHHVFGDYITQNVMMSFFAVIATQNFFHSSIKLKKIFWGVVTVLAIVSISDLSGSRTGLVLLTVGLLSYAISARRGKALLSALIGTILIIQLNFWSSNIMQDRLSMATVEAQRHSIDNMTSIGHRLYNYKITPRLISEQPFFGHGTGAYHTEICRFLERQDWCPIFSWHPHNQYMFFAADHGILGMSLYLFLILTLYRTALKSGNFESKVLLFSLASMLLVDSLFNSPLFSSRESQFFIYIISLLVSMCQPVKTEQSWRE